MEKACANRPAKSRQRSENEILDEATKRLLRATKEEAKKHWKPINYESLRREGYSDRFIEKVREAWPISAGASQAQEFNDGDARERRRPPRENYRVRMSPISRECAYDFDMVQSPAPHQLKSGS